jgi:hypothetical protein
MAKNYKGMISEWSVLVDVDSVPTATPKSFHIEATEDERVDLARRMGILSVERAVADITLQRVRGGVIHALGTLYADVTQACVISLAPIAESMETEFEGWFGGDDAAVSFARAKSEREAKKPGVETEILEESVDPEPIINGKIDIGELAAQHMSLSLDPYPHAQGVAYELGVDSHEETPEGINLRKNPFEALKDWKEKR